MKQRQNKAVFLLLVSIWLVFAPGFYELQKLNALEVPEPETQTVRDIPESLDEFITAAEAIKDFNLLLFTSEEPNEEDVEITAGAQFARMILDSSFGEQASELSREINSFYKDYKEIKGLNSKYSGYLGTILTWNNKLSSGRALSDPRIKAKVDILGDSFAKLNKLGIRLAKAAGSKIEAKTALLSKLADKRLRVITTFKANHKQAFTFLTKSSQAVKTTAAWANVIGETTSFVLGKVAPFIAFASSLHDVTNNEHIDAGVGSYDSLSTSLDFIQASIGVIMVFAAAKAVLIFATVGLVYFAVKSIIEAGAADYAREIKAYKDAREFLMQADPEYPVYETAFKEKQLTPDEIESMSDEELERHILNNYYLQNKKELVTFVAGSDNTEALDTYSKIWEQKALFLAWQPIESVEDDGRLTRAGHKVKNFARMLERLRPDVKDDYKDILNGLHPLMANPDFVLISMLHNYVTLVAANEGDPQLLFKRVKYDPFNFMYLLQIPQNTYSSNDYQIFKEAIALDSLKVGWLELSAIKATLDEVSKEMDLQSEYYIDSLADQVGAIKTLEEPLGQALALSKKLNENYDARVDNAHARLGRDLSKYFDKILNLKVYDAYMAKFERSATSWKNFTYADMFKLPEFKEAFEKFMLIAPLAFNTYYATIQEAMTTTDANTLLIRKLTQFAKEAEDNLKNYREFITAPEIKAFSEKGKYLGIREGGFLGFVADIRPLETRYENMVKLLKNSVRNFSSENARISKKLDSPGSGRGARSSSYRDATKMVNKLAEAVVEITHYHDNQGFLTFSIDPSSDFAKNIFLSQRFELKRFESFAQ